MRTQIVQAALNQQDKSLPKSISNGEFVEGLKIVDSSTNLEAAQADFTQEQLDSFLRCLPQLRRIDLNLANDKCPRYLGYVMDILKNSSRNNEVLTRLEDISAAITNSKGMAQYFKVCYAIKD